MVKGDRRRFRPGFLATLAVMVALAVLVGLGIWQLQRLQWKEELLNHIQMQLAAAPLPLHGLPESIEALDYRRVRVQGELWEERSFALGVAVRAGEVGARLITPARLADGALVLIDRGFLPEPVLPPAVPPAMQANGPVVIEGVARLVANLQSRWFQPADEPARRRFWQLAPHALRQFLGEEAPQLLVVAERAEPPHILAAVEPFRPTIHNPHLGYALTWFGLAAGLLVIYLLFGVARGQMAIEKERCGR